MAEMTHGSYNAIDVLRATIQWTLYNKLSAADAPLMIWWGRYARTLEPQWEWDFTRDHEDEFRSRLYVPNNELIRAGLHRSTAFCDIERGKPAHFMVGEEAYRHMKYMKKSELDAWAENRLYECLPWLKQ